MRLGLENKSIKSYKDENLYKYLKIRVKDLIDIEENELDRNLNLFIQSFLRKWNSCCRRHDLFIIRHKEWLTKIFHEKKVTVTPTKMTKCLGGRPTVPFSAASRATKYRKSSELAIVSPDRLKMASTIKKR